jgi:hypothetical protein
VDKCILTHCADSGIHDVIMHYALFRIKFL